MMSDEKMKLAQARLYEIYGLARDLYDFYDFENDVDDTARLLKRILKLTGICWHCDGLGVDGDPPDPAGDGGWEGPCAKCGGTGDVIPGGESDA